MSVLISAEGHIHFVPRMASVDMPPCIIEASSLELLDTRIVRYDEAQETFLAQSAFQCQTPAGLFRWHVYVDHDENGSWLRAISQERPDGARIIEDTLTFSIEEDDMGALPLWMKRLIRQEIQQALQEEGLDSAQIEQASPPSAWWPRAGRTLNAYAGMIALGSIIVYGGLQLLGHWL